MSESDSNVGHNSWEHEPATEAVEDALHVLAANTNVDPIFAASLETKLFMAADAMVEEVAEQGPWWQRLLQWMHDAISVRPLRYGIAMAGLILALLLFSTPVVRATLWDWFYGTGFIAEQAVTDRKLPLETPVIDEAASLSLQALQTEAPFAIAPPAWLPRALVYTGGFIDPTATGTQVTLVFHPPTADGASPTDLVGQPLLFMLVSNGAIENRPLLAEEQVVPVQIRLQSGGSALAMYAHGGWRSMQPVTPESSTVDDLYWDATADEAWLSWQMNGLNYLLYAQGLGVTRQEMVQMAESIATE